MNKTDFYAKDFDISGDFIFAPLVWAYRAIGIDND